MSYGQNAPWGLQAIRTQTDASWNGKTSNYLIASGYANNIFKGDLVYIFTDGYIRNLFDVGNQTVFVNQAALGVFDGCSFAVPTSVNPIDPANPGRPYWPAGQQTVGGVPAIASVITDPNVVYNVQVTGNTGGVQANVGVFASASYIFSGATGVNSAAKVQGNFNTGTSSLSLNIATISNNTPTLNFFIDALSSNPNNVSGQQYNNVEVMISNHFFRVMPTHPIT